VNHGPTLIYILLSFLLFIAPASEAEPGQLSAADSPSWLGAVGTLVVPGHRFEQGERLHHSENCSATLIGAQTILTAWHCLEYYKDLSQDIVFSLPGQPQHPQWRARRLADGKGMDADWALLRLERPVPRATPLAVVSRFQVQDIATISMAGYPGQTAEGGSNRTGWHAQCRITGNEGYRIATNCEAQKGASGGPVINRGKIVGVISAGDGEGLTYYAPATAFIAAVRLHRR
jgi:hypothetical protein